MKPSLIDLDQHLARTGTERSVMSKALKFIGLFVVVFSVAINAGLATAQRKPARIGVLGAPEEPRFSEVVAGLKRGLRELGYADKTIEILEARVHRSDHAGERVAIENMARERAQVLFAIGSRFVALAREVSTALPIVFLTPGDPVASGLVASLARPGGNATGMTFEYPELSGKRLELLKEIAPKTRRVLVLYDPRDDSPRQSLAAARQAAPSLKVTLIERAVRSREDVTQALKILNNADAILEIPGGQPTAEQKAIIQATNDKRLPTIFHARGSSTEHALASYGASDAEIARQAARLVDKILKGANAGELPVERPTKLEFVISLKTAKQIGLAIPPNVLARADRVIR